MADPTAQGTNSQATKSAPKDKVCPYCHQVFTSSSLGRHLDLYIKEKNPKAPDGIHDVDAIRKLRGNITRRLQRASTGGGKPSTPSSTPRPSGANRDTPTAESDSHKPASIPKDGQYAVDSTLSKFPFVPGWEATGVINGISANDSWDHEVPPDAAARRPSAAQQRTVSRQTSQKLQLDSKQKLADAMDTARAAELAYRELLGSWIAAKQHIDNNSMPFDFKPLSLDFPALTLQCLRPPPTLYSSTQHPTPTSWAVDSPGPREYSALQSFFKQEFQKWKVACASATAATLEELTYPPNSNPQKDARETVKQAEGSAENLERQVEEHLRSAYAAWNSQPASRQKELWILELARSVGRKQEETLKLKEERHSLQQENANLKSHIDHLNRLQQPREFKLLSPATIPISRELIHHVCEQGVKGAKSVGLSLEDRDVDLNTLVTRSIERWKEVITSTRASENGLAAQKPLEEAAPTPQDGVPNGSQAQQLPPPPPPPPQASQTNSKRLSAASANAPPSEQTSSSVSNTGPPSMEETSDQDADAEMEDDDSFAIHNMHTSPVKSTMQQQSALNVPRTRGLVTQNAPQDMGFMMPNGPGRQAIPMSRSMVDMSIAMQANHPLQGTDLSLIQPVRSDAMYME